MFCDAFYRRHIASQYGHPSITVHIIIRAYGALKMADMKMRDITVEVSSPQYNVPDSVAGV